MTVPDDPYAFNPFDPDETQHMWDLLARMRAEAPVTHPMEGMAYIARYADNAAVFKDAKRFSSAGGFRGPGVVVPEPGEVPALPTPDLLGPPGTPPPPPPRL